MNKKKQARKISDQTGGSGSIVQDLQAAVALHERGAWKEAEAAYQSVLKRDPRQFDALHLSGVIAHQRGDHAQALALIERALALKPDVAAAHNNRASALKSLARFPEACDGYRRAIALQPDYLQAHTNLGILLSERGQPNAAIEHLQKALVLDPRNKQNWLRLSMLQRDKGVLTDAIASARSALDIDPRDPHIHNSLGILLRRSGRLDEALEHYDRSLELDSALVAARINRANVLSDLGRMEEAEATFNDLLAAGSTSAIVRNAYAALLDRLDRSQEALAQYDNVIAQEPSHALTQGYRAMILRKLGRLDEALAGIDAALASDPESATLLTNRGSILTDMHRLDDAMAHFDRALAINPAEAAAYNLRANILRVLRRYDEALRDYDAALAINPKQTGVLSNKGLLLEEMTHNQQALEVYDKAIEYDDQCFAAHLHRGNVLRRMLRFPEAVASYQRAVAINPDHDYVFGLYLHTKMMNCDWSDFDQELALMVRKLDVGQRVSMPFPLLGLLDSPEHQRKAAAIYSQSFVELAEQEDQQVPLQGSSGDKIKIGYFSSDFYNHATSFLMAEAFEQHDRNRFEWHAFSFGPPRQDLMQRRIAASFDHFHDVRTKSDTEICNLARSLGIDIAVDLKGQTNDSRPGIFARRAAPIQVNYLGYPGTMSMPGMDYIIADKVLIPREAQPHYSEQVVWMPGCYQVNDSQRVISDHAFTREEVGLPATGFVFCSFNNTYKIVPDVFDIWMRLLAAVEGGVLWLLRDNVGVEEHLRQHAAERGVDPARLVFASRLPLAEHLARHRLADLFLDTWPCNAHTTASDALWAGLPLLTRSGKSFAARVAASLLTVLGLPELIADDVEDYEAIALALAKDPARLAQLKTRLQANLKVSSLFDGKIFARHLEAAYAAMYIRSRAALPPIAFEVHEDGSTLVHG